MDKLLSNKLGGACHQLTMTANQKAEEAELTELLVHCWVVMAMLERNRLPEPLVGLMLSPGNMKASQYVVVQLS